VADLILASRTGFAGLAVPGRYGRTIGGERPVVVAERPNLTIAHIGAHRGKEAEMAEAVRAASGIELPQTPRRAAAGGLAFIGYAPQQWLAIGEGDKGRALLARISEGLAGLAAFVDQSDAKAMLRLSGPRVRDMLAKGCALDLHPRAFQPQDAATTQLALIPCQLWQLDEAPTFELAVPLSYARSLWSWLTASAAEYGYEVKPPLAL
jgi:heterotetrameric sarcosine oxidase gamma subunit